MGQGVTRVVADERRAPQAPIGAPRRKAIHRRPTGSRQAHRERRGPQKIPGRHPGPEEHHPSIGWAACRARPVLDRRGPWKHRFVDRRLLAAGRYDALQFVFLRKPPGRVALPVQSHCAVPVQKLDRARTAAGLSPLLAIAASHPGKIGALVVDCVAKDLEARCDRHVRDGRVAFGSRHAGFGGGARDQHCTQYACRISRLAPQSDRAAVQVARRRATGNKRRTLPETFTPTSRRSGAGLRRGP